MTRSTKTSDNAQTGRIFSKKYFSRLSCKKIDSFQNASRNAAALSFPCFLFLEKAKAWFSYTAELPATQPPVLPGILFRHMRTYAVGNNDHRRPLPPASLRSWLRLSSTSQAGRRFFRNAGEKKVLCERNRRSSVMAEANITNNSIHPR